VKPFPQLKVAIRCLLIARFLILSSLLTAQNKQAVVDLSWQQDTDQVAGYNIYRSDVSGGPYAKINPALDTNTTYVDSTVVAAHTYYYVTTAVNSVGQESGYSNESQAMVPNGGGGNEFTIGNFNGNSGSGQPSAGLTLDKNGNLYGTTKTGGTYNQGTIFKLTAGSNGFTQTVLYNFTGSQDGAQPAAEMIFDSTGNLYGTTTAGGSGSCNGGCGVVFELMPSSGSWSESVLYSFTGSADGAQPSAALIFDSAGNLYGTTVLGGNLGSNCSTGCGVVFKLTKESGGFTESAVYTFAGGNDGAYPYASVVFDASGSLYGTTSGGGSYSKGTAFKLAPNGSTWTETVLHTFTGANDGASPYASLVLDSTGTVYGTAAQGGASGYGVIFKILPDGRGGWKEGLLHTFGNKPAATPMAGLLFDSTGNLYGTTQMGGTFTACGGACGTLFQLAPTPNKSSSFKTLHQFGRTGDGYRPVGRLIEDSAGNLYGATQMGGPQNSGTVFQLKP
jgi:uncharacterized repeat protein (TIGR03803 family)